MCEDRPTLAALEAAGIVRADGASYRTTRRWQAAMARAAFRLLVAREPSGDLRLPIVSALIELFGAELADHELLRLVEAILPIELAELSPPGPTAPLEHRGP